MNRIKLLVAWTGLLALATIGQNSFASTLSGELTVDNSETVYISTSDSVAGAEIVAGASWPVTESFSGIELVAGQDYFLHVHGVDAGFVAGFLGEFSIEGIDHLFANGATTIATNDTDWLVSTSGWGDYVGASSLGVNGIAPWGPFPSIDASAQWLWSTDAINDNEAFFTLAIIATPVPLPPAIWLFASAVAGVVGFRSRNAQT